MPTHRLIFTVMSLGLVILMGPSLASAQSQACEGLDRPCVALVLAGGGARGGVHVGVLNVLEKYRVPVDMVMGTSIGAVVAGAYAAGYDAGELDELVAGIDWNEIFAARPPRVDRSIRRKEEDYDLTIGTELGVRGFKPQLPRGILPDQNLDFLLQTISGPVSGIQDFDSLPTPFRAVAADLVSGEAVVLADGSLAEAMRASLSLPGVFNPVSRDGRLLVDGGIAMNFPVELALAAGADVIIAVEMPRPPKTPEDFQTALSVAGQLSDLLIARPQADSRAKLRPQDLHLTPDLHGIETMDFGRMMETVPFGEEEAERFADRLQDLSLPQGAWEDWLARRADVDRELPVVEFIRVAGSNALNPEAILSRISLQPGDRLDTDQLHRDLGKIYGMGWYEMVGYRVVREDGRLGLEVRLEDKPWGPHYLRSGIRLYDNLSGRSSYRLSLSYLSGPVNGRGGEYRIGATLGDPLSLVADFYQPLDNPGRFFGALGAGVERFTTPPVFSGAGAGAAARGTILAFEGALGVNFGSSAELRVGPSYVGVGADLAVSGVDELVPLDYDELNLVTRFLLDRLDNPFFPTEGAFLRAEWIAGTDWWVGEDDFHRLEVDGSVGTSVGRHAFRLGGEMGTSFGTDLPPLRAFTLGGPGRLSGLGAVQIVGLYKGLGYLRYDFTLLDMPDYGLIRSVKIGGTGEAGNVWIDTQDIGWSDLVYGGSVFLGVDTLFGPVFVGFGLASGGESAWSVSIGSLR